MVVMGDNRNRLWDPISRLAKWITGVIGFLTLLVSFVKLVQSDFDLVSKVGLVVLTGAAWLASARLAFRWLPGQTDADSRLVRFKRVTRLSGLL